MPFKTRQIVRSEVNWKRLAAGSVILGNLGVAAVGFSVRMANEPVDASKLFLRCLSAMPDDQRDVIDFSQQTILVWRRGGAGRHHRDPRIAGLSRR